MDSNPLAFLFVWVDLWVVLLAPSSKVPFAREHTITQPLARHRGKVFTTAGDKLFVLDPLAMRVTQTIQLPAPQIEISLNPLGQEKLAGLTTQGVYVYDIKAGEVVHRARSPAPVRCGFALLHDAVDFGSNAELWRYHIPRSPPAGELDPVQSLMEIWDLHCHLGGLPGTTPEARLAQLLQYADRLGIARLCISMGMEGTTIRHRKNFDRRTMKCCAPSVLIQTARSVSCISTRNLRRPASTS